VFGEKAAIIVCLVWSHLLLVGSDLLEKIVQKKQCSRVAGFSFRPDALVVQATA